jgi:adenylate cyclase
VVGIPRKLVRSRRTVSALITSAVFAVVGGARSAGDLEALELGAYDWFLRSLPMQAITENPIVLVKLREHEIQKYGHPLCDARLALALSELRRLGARAIGVDLWRDVPIRSCGGTMGDRDLPEAGVDLAEVVLRDERIVMIENPLEDPPIAPPSFVAGSGQTAVADIPVHPSGVVRRALIYYTEADTTYFSLGFQLALQYLADEGIYPINDPEQPDYIRLGETTIPSLRSDHGGYWAVDSGGYQYLADFALGHDGFPVYTLEELFSGSIPADALRDKIVVLGTESATVKDEFYTPFSPTRPNDPFMLGMEIHAHAIHQLIRFAHGDTSPMASWAEGSEYAWTLLWCALGGLLGFSNRAGWFTALASIAGLLMLGGASRVAFQANLWIPLVPPLLGFVSAAALVLAYRAIAERAERSEVTGLFSRFLRPEVAELIWEQRDQFIGPDQRPRAQRITLTSLMSDLQGYTTASESMEPEALMTWINEYMNTMADLVAEYDGVVDDYAGDGIKANFGFPVPSLTDEAKGEDAHNAVRCALAMGRAMDHLNRNWRARGMPTGRVRVGIFTGPAVVGILGGGKSLKYTTVGDTVNTAARLESFAKDEFSSEQEGADWRVLVGDATMERLDEAFLTQDLGLHALKGKHEEIRIFRVLGASEADGDSLIPAASTP